MSDSDISRERTFEKYATDESGLQGRVTISEGRRTIELFKPADASTTMHLMSDLWFDEMVHDTSLPYAPESIKNDLEIVLDWLGVRTVKDIGTEQRQQWARGFEQYLMEGKAPSASLVSSFKYFREQLRTIYRTPDVLGPPITDGIRGVFDRMLATNEEIAKMRAVEAGPHTVSAISRSSTDRRGNATTLCPTPDSVSSVRSSVLAAKGLAGFASGFILMFGLELLLFWGMEFVSGHRLRPMGAGWVVMPILAGCGGWTLCREIDFAKAIGVSRISAEFRKWPREHKIALAIAIAVGWIIGVLTGYLASVAGRPDYYPPTLGTWLFGRWNWSYNGELSVRYFPWASLAWGFTGGVVSAAVIFVRQLLRSEGRS
ncbi:MAG TPA: hypothetical protein VNO18_01750 [Xanthobacteraceae bacterium]|nr:hypothetical protein [Xanthobacteraceae bacterium]